MIKLHRVAINCLSFFPAFCACLPLQQKMHKIFRPKHCAAIALYSMETFILAFNNIKHPNFRQCTDKGMSSRAFSEKTVLVQYVTSYEPQSSIPWVRRAAGRKPQLAFWAGEKIGICGRLSRGANWLQFLFLVKKVMSHPSQTIIDFGKK